MANYRLPSSLGLRVCAPQPARRWTLNGWLEEEQGEDDDDDDSGALAANVVRRTSRGEMFVFIEKVDLTR